MLCAYDGPCHAGPDQQEERWWRFAGLLTLWAFLFSFSLPVRHDVRWSLRREEEEARRSQGGKKGCCFCWDREEKRLDEVCDRLRPGSHTTHTRANRQDRAACDRQSRASRWPGRHPDGPLCPSLFSPPIIRRDRKKTNKNKQHSSCCVIYYMLTLESRSFIIRQELFNWISFLNCWWCSVVDEPDRHFRWFPFLILFVVIGVRDRFRTDRDGVERVPPAAFLSYSILSMKFNSSWCALSSAPACKL